MIYGCCALMMSFLPSELDVNRVCQRGCEPGEGGSVLMANSVTLADACRLWGGETGRGEGPLWQGRGQLVLCKVFVGQTAEVTGSGRYVRVCHELPGI